MINYFNVSSVLSFKNVTLRQQENQETTTLGFMATKVFFYFAILVSSTLGNALVSCIIISTKKMRTPSNFLILNLSICDLVTPLVSIPFDFILEENGYQWPYGAAMCKFLWPFATLTTTSSSLSLAVISLDRYRVIMHPFKRRLSARHVNILIAIIHFISLCLVSPYMKSLKLENGSCNEHWSDFSHRQVYTFSLFLVQYGLPLIYMGVMYTLAVKNINLSSNKVKNNVIKGEHRFLHANKSWNNLNAVATKMFIVVVLVFSVCMLPNQVVWLWADFGNGTKHRNFQMAAVICWLFTYTNSVCNPAIYFRFSKDFRAGLKKLLRNFYCWKTKTRTNGKRRNSLQRNSTETMSHSALTASANSQMEVHRCQATPPTSKNDVYHTLNRKNFHYPDSDSSRNKTKCEINQIKDKELLIVLTGMKDKSCNYSLAVVNSITHDNVFKISSDVLITLKYLPETNCWVSYLVKVVKLDVVKTQVYLTLVGKWIAFQIRHLRKGIL